MTAAQFARVRRSRKRPGVSAPVPTPLTPAGIASKYIWLDASQEAYADNAEVLTATDWIAGRNATHPGGPGPIFKTNIINGKPVYRFTGTQWLIFGNVLSALTEAEVFIVWYNATAGQENCIWSMGLDWDFHPNGANGIIYDSFGSTARNMTVAPARSLALPNIYNVSSAPGAWTNRLNGTVLFTTAANAVAFVTAPLLGRSPAGSYVLNGNIAELFISSAVLSVADRAALHSYFSTKYNIAVA